MCVVLTYNLRGVERRGREEYRISEDTVSGVVKKLIK